MRTIKFRTWYSGGKMQTIGDKWAGDVFVRLNGEKVICIDTGEWEQGMPTHFAKDNLGLVLMQFTGVKDVNGKDVYEGDILKVGISNEFGSMTDDLGKVVYSDDHGAFLILRVGNEDMKVHLYIEGAKPNIKVVGNIYENPELLTPYPLKEGR